MGKVRNLEEHHIAFYLPVPINRRIYFNNQATLYSELDVNKIPKRL